MKEGFIKRTCICSTGFSDGKRCKDGEAGLPVDLTAERPESTECEQAEYNSSDDDVRHIHLFSGSVSQSTNSGSFRGSNAVCNV